MIQADYLYIYIIIKQRKWAFIIICGNFDIWRNKGNFSIFKFFCGKIRGNKKNSTAFHLIHIESWLKRSRTCFLTLKPNKYQIETILAEQPAKIEKNICYVYTIR